MSKSVRKYNFAGDGYIKIINEDNIKLIFATQGIPPMEFVPSGSGTLPKWSDLLAQDNSDHGVGIRLHNAQQNATSIGQLEGTSAEHVLTWTWDDDPTPTGDYTFKIGYDTNKEPIVVCGSGGASKKWIDAWCYALDLNNRYANKDYLAANYFPLNATTPAGTIVSDDSNGLMMIRNFGDGKIAGFEMCSINFNEIVRFYKTKSDLNYFDDKESVNFQDLGVDSNTLINLANGEYFLTTTLDDPQPGTYYHTQTFQVKSVNELKLARYEKLIEKLIEREIISEEDLEEGGQE